MLTLLQQLQIGMPVTVPTNGDDTTSVTNDDDDVLLAAAPSTRHRALVFAQV
jgi:hypothetical protein